MKFHYLFLSKCNYNSGVLIFLDTRPNLTHPSRNSLPRTAPISSTSFTASPRVLPIPFFTDVPEFPSSKPGHGSVGAHGFPRNGEQTSGGAWLSPGVGRGWTFEPGKGRGLGPLGKFGPQQPPSRESAEGDPGAGVAEPVSRSWLEMEFDSEALRRLLGKVRAAGQAVSGAPGSRGVRPWPAYFLGAFTGFSRGSEPGWAGLKPAAGNGCGAAAALAPPAVLRSPQPPPALTPSHATSFSLSQRPALAYLFNHAFLSAEMAYPHPHPSVFDLSVHSLGLRCYSLGDRITPSSLLAFGYIDYHIVE